MGLKSGLEALAGGHVEAGENPDEAREVILIAETLGDAYEAF